MNLVRYLNVDDVPKQYRNLYWLLSLGNDFSDRKSATLAIDTFQPSLRNTVRIAVYYEHDDSVLCYYVAP
jgi:hypothetical protein